MDNHFVSQSCIGEDCGMCRRENLITQATHKLGEEIPDDYRGLPRHNLTQYVCCRHFALIVGLESARRYTGCYVAEKAPS